MKENLKTDDLESTLSRIKGRKGVIGVIILDIDGSPLVSTFDNKTTQFYTNNIYNIIKSANILGKSAVDPLDEIQLIRLHFKKHTILVAPDKRFIFLTIQETNYFYYNGEIIHEISKNNI
ncbi:Roadblock/LC7 domain-containing protein [Cryptosporidium serpentis]